MKFRKKPVVVEATQWIGDVGLLIEWDKLHGPSGLRFGSGAIVMIPTLEGEMIARVGDWIIKGIAGEFYSCKPRIFTELYEQVEEGAPPQ